MKHNRKWLFFVVPLVFVLVVCLVFVFVILPRPKNIFYEIQSAEYARAKHGQNTVLSGTTYFEKSTATLHKNGNDYAIDEVSAAGSPFSLATGQQGLNEIFVSFGEGNIFVGLSYTEKTDDCFLVFMYEFNSKSLSSTAHVGFYVSWAVYENETVAETYSGKTLVSSRDSEEKQSSVLSGLGLTRKGVHQQVIDKWDLFLSQWFKAYPKSRFSMNNLGDFTTTYE